MNIASFSAPLSHIIKAFVLNYICGILFDALVVVLTVYRTGRLAWQSRKAGIGITLSFILVRDGKLHSDPVLQLLDPSLGSLYYRSGSSTCVLFMYSQQLIVQYSFHSLFCLH